jgi:rRNA maturation RNase YbeY
MRTKPINQQKNHPIHLEKIKRLTDWLAQKLDQRTAPQTWGEISIIFVDDLGITQTNCEYFGKDRPTDVISFHYDPIPGEADERSGDLIINVDRAVSEGTARGNINHELALYIAHGFDHLSGAEDDTPEKRKKMLATETAWLESAQKEGLIDQLID